MNNYQAAAAQAGFPPASPHGAGGHGGPQGRSFPAANSPGPIDMYSSGAAAAAAVAAADSVASYVQAAASPQPPTTAFPAIAVSRAPLNYSPVSPLNISPLSLDRAPPERNGTKGRRAWSRVQRYGCDDSALSTCRSTYPYTIYDSRSTRDFWCLESAISGTFSVL